MPSSSISNTTALVSTATVLKYVQWSQFADWLSTTDTRLAEGALVDGHSIFDAIRLSATGRAESVCLRGGQYQPSDLAALSGAGKALLEWWLSWLCALEAWQRRARKSNAEDMPPGCKEALDFEEKVLRGERVFPLQDHFDAMAGEVVKADGTALPALPRIQPSSNALPYFGHRMGG